MVASRTTTKQIYKVLQKHLERSQITKILSDMQKVKGNRSVEDSINALVKYHVDMVIAQEESEE